MTDTINYIKKVQTPKIGAIKKHIKYGNDLQPQIYKTYNDLYAEEVSQYSSDFVIAEVQGLTDNINEYTKVKARLSDLHTNLQANGLKNDDVKILMIPNRKYNYLHHGAFVKTMGNTWIITNPTNMTGTYTEAVIVRCNASYNSYDYYGNVITEPIYISNEIMSDNANSKGINFRLMDGYFNVICQKNENTQRLGENKRIILGNRAFYITGYTDFIQEFTGDRDSCDIISFTIRAEETKDSDDLLTNFIADGNNYSFDIELTGDSTLKQNEEATYTYRFIKNGEEITPTSEYPQTYTIESSDETILSVDSTNKVTAVGIGTATLTLKMAENSSLYDILVVEVKAATNEPEIQSLSLIPLTIEQYDTATLEFAYFENGVETNEALTYSFSGAGAKHYNATISEDTKTLTIECVSASRYKLNINIECQGITKTIQISLVGY